MDVHFAPERAKHSVAADIVRMNSVRAADLLWP